LANFLRTILVSSVHRLIQPFAALHQTKHKLEAITPMQTFDRFVDVEQIKVIFQQALPECRENALVITHCTILHAHYHTSTKHHHKAQLGICYQLDGIHAVWQTAWTQLIYGRARADGKSLAEFIGAEQSTCVTPSIGPALLHLPEHDVTFWSFPNDPQLPHLPLVVDGDKVKSYLPYQVLPDGWAENPLSQQVTVEIIHYYPEERCTLRYHLHGGTLTQPQTITLIGKTFRDDSGEKIYRRLQEAWQQSIAQPGQFRVAQPLAYTAAIKTIWMRHEAGAPLLRVINPTNAGELLSSVARGLVALQCSKFSGTKPLTFGDQVRELESKVQKLSHALPDLAPSLQAMAACLAQEAVGFEQSAGLLIHGDFHIRQLLVDQDEIIFLDFDELALGDPLQDVANFIVDLHFEGFPRPLVREMARLFVQAYCTYADWPVPLARLQWHIRYQFLTRAYRFYRQHRLNLHEEVQQVLVLAEDILLWKQS
jgi:thiamine kinase-like enzyme